MRQINLLLFLGVLVFASCNNNSGEELKKAKEDSTVHAQIQADSLLKLRQLDTLKALGLATLSDSVCTGIGRLLFSTDGLIQDPIDFSISLGQMIECNNREWNNAHPDDTRVTVASQTSDDNGNPKILFNTISLKTGEDVADASKKIIVAIIAAKTANPMAVAIGTVAANYSVNAFLNAAKRNDPLIIIMPNQIPNIQLGKDAWSISKEGFKAASKLPIDKPFTLQLAAGKTIVNAAIVGAKAAEKYILKNGKAVLKDGINIPVVGHGPANPTNISSPIGPLGPVGPVLGPIIKKFW